MRRLTLVFAAVILIFLGSLAQSSILKVNACVTTLLVTDTKIPFGIVFPEEVLYKKFNVALSSTFLSNKKYDDIEYHIQQTVKPLKPCDADYCQKHPTDYTKCYPNLCPYLSKEPDDAYGNDTGVEAFHDPNALSSVAHGVLSRSDNDLADKWTIDLHVPCFAGKCAQDNVIPPGYEANPKLEGKNWGCDLNVVVDKISYLQKTTRTLGFWQTHTTFTSNIFQSKFSGSMTVGSGSHARTITNVQTSSASRLFGAFYSSIPKKTNNTNRISVDNARMQLLQQLVTAKLNCAAFSCPAETQNLITSADSAYGGNNGSLMTTLAGQLNTYNISFDSGPIPPELGDPGSATPGTSQSWANKVFWDSP
jgi:hypothetical protein